LPALNTSDNPHANYCETHNTITLTVTVKVSIVIMLCLILLFQ